MTTGRSRNGHGTHKHESKAMEYFRKAADQGHPHASYNLAVGYLQGMKTDIKPGYEINILYELLVYF
jgi:TPR repeat protein